MTSSTSNAASRTWWQRAAGLLLAALAVYFLLKEVPPAELGRLLAGVRPGWLLAALAAAFVGQFCKALRWKTLLRPGAASPSTARLLIYLLAGQLVNLFVPARAGDVGRAVVLGAEGTGRMFALGTVALEKVLDFLVYTALIGVLILTVPLPEWLGGSPLLVLLAGAGLSLALAAAIRYWDRLAPLISSVLARVPRIGARLARLPGAAAEALAAFRSPGSVGALVGWTALIWVAGILVNHWTLLAFGVNLPVWASIALIVFLQAGVSAGVVPGTIGVFEFICVRTLALYQVPETVGLGYALVLHFVVLLPLLAGGGAVLFITRR